VVVGVLVTQMMERMVLRVVVVLVDLLHRVVVPQHTVMMVEMLMERV
tara:strand:+ start:191 stop:331 length:141 start_codon:yes stop_codon:yes gene_type:complete